MNKPGERNNGAYPTDPLRNVYAGTLADIIETKRVPLEAREIVPIITNTDGLDISSRSISWVMYNYTGDAVITDLRPDTVPTIESDASPESAKMKWISIGVKTTIRDKDDIATGKVKPMSRTLEAFRVIGEQEDTFVLDGFSKLGADGMNSLAASNGIHIVPAGKTWATMNGEEIVESVRKLSVALVTGKRFSARTLVLPQVLDLMLDRTYTDSTGSATPAALSIRKVLQERNYFENYKSSIRITTPLGLDDLPENFGFVPNIDRMIGETYKEGRTEITPIEEHISEFILLQPESVAKMTGAQ